MRIGIFLLLTGQSAMGLLFGRLQRYVTDVKADISREMELDELRKLQKQVQGAAQEFKTSVESAAQNVHEGVRSVDNEMSIKK